MNKKVSDFKKYFSLPKGEMIIRKTESRKKPAAKKSFFGKLNEMEFFSYTKFSVRKQTFFAKRLSFLIKSGVPMLESIRVLKAQAGSRGESNVLSRIIDDLSNGQSLANALARLKNIFGNLIINVIRAGEASGTLAQNLNYLADELKKREILRRKIRSALLYPAIVTLATFGIVGFLTVYIFPKIMPIFQSVKINLPLSTRIIIFLSALVKDHGFFMLTILTTLILTYILMKKYIPGIRFWNDGLILHLPIFGPIAQNYNLTNSLRTFSILLKSGISLNATLLITADTTDNTRYKKAFRDLHDSIIKGKTVSQIIGAHPLLFPPMVTHMIAIGEKSGNLSSTFMYLSEYYEHEFDEQTKNLSSTIEPVLMIIMGVMVGFVAISVITPIYELTSSFSR